MTSKKKKQRDPRETDQETAEAPQVDRDPEDQSSAEAQSTLEAERNDLLARLQRVSADYSNYQKRVQRDLAQAREFANDNLIKNLLPVLDDMELALTAARDNHGEDDPLFKGMQMVHDKALEVLGRFGLAPIEAEGKQFDPDRHTALMQRPCDTSPPNTVLQEVQRGFELKGRTIRPSGVIVSKPSAEPRESSSQADEESE